MRVWLRWKPFQFNNYLCDLAFNNKHFQYEYIAMLKLLYNTGLSIRVMLKHQDDWVQLKGKWKDLPRDTCLKGWLPKDNWISTKIRKSFFTSISLNYILEIILIIPFSISLLYYCLYFALIICKSLCIIWLKCWKKNSNFSRKNISVSLLLPYKWKIKLLQ